MAFTTADAADRDFAIDQLQSFLQAADGLTELDYAKLWKALFYCAYLDLRASAYITGMWHSDKPLVQEDLADKLCSLMESAKPSDTWVFFRAFWTVIIREWIGIDRLRWIYSQQF